MQASMMSQKSRSGVRGTHDTKKLKYQTLNEDVAAMKSQIANGTNNFAQKSLWKRMVQREQDKRVRNAAPYIRDWARCGTIA